MIIIIFIHQYIIIVYKFWTILTVILHLNTKRKKEKRRCILTKNVRDVLLIAIRYDTIQYTTIFTIITNNICVFKTHRIKRYLILCQLVMFKLTYVYIVTKLGVI